jgi:hypothetical protein
LKILFAFGLSLALTGCESSQWVDVPQAPGSYEGASYVSNPAVHETHLEREEVEKQADRELEIEQ